MREFDQPRTLAEWERYWLAGPDVFIDAIYHRHRSLWHDAAYVVAEWYSLSEEPLTWEQGQAIAHLWVDIDWPEHDVWEEFFEELFSRGEGLQLMRVEDYDALEALPNPIRIWRGYGQFGSEHHLHANSHGARGFSI